MNDIKKHDEDQEEKYRAEQTAKRKKRIVKGIIFLAVFAVILVIITAIVQKCTSENENSIPYSYDPLAEDHGTGFYEQTLDHDIFTDPDYADKDKGIWFYTDTMGEYFTSEESDGASAQALMFLEYFKAAIHGDGATLNTLFTDEYFENYGRRIEKYPDKFPMQKIYAIKVEQVAQTKTSNTVQGTVMFDSYRVTFLIKDNNGAFRPDLPEPDGGSIPLIYDVITLNGVSHINRIYQIVYRSVS